MLEMLDGSNIWHRGWLVPTASWPVLRPYQGNLSRSHHGVVGVNWVPSQQPGLGADGGSRPGTKVLQPPLPSPVPSVSLCGPGGHAWPAAVAADPPSGSAEAHFVRRFLHPAPSPRRGGGSARGQPANCSPGHGGTGTRHGGHGLATPCSRAGHPTNCWGAPVTGRDMSLAPLWGFQLLPSSPQNPSSPRQATPHGKHHQPHIHTRVWPHLASLAGTFPGHQGQAGMGTRLCPL